MENRPPIALWKRPDGSTCVLDKSDGVWMLTIEKAGVVEKQLIVPSPMEGIERAKNWRDGVGIDVA